MSVIFVAVALYSSPQQDMAFISTMISESLFDSLCRCTKTHPCFFVISY